MSQLCGKKREGKGTWERRNKNTTEEREVKDQEGIGVKCKDERYATHRRHDHNRKIKTVQTN